MIVNLIEAHSSYLLLVEQEIFNEIIFSKNYVADWYNFSNFAN